MVGRNDPCPCGSGKKYKKCCLLAAQAGSDQVTPRLINRSSEEAVEVLLRHAYRTRSTRFLEDAWRALWPGGERRFVKGDPFGHLAIPWALYVWNDGDRGTPRPGTVAAELLRTPAGRQLPARTRAFIEACQRQPLTFFQASDVEPGSGLTLRDLATGDEGFVHERSATQVIKDWDIVFGQVVEVEGCRSLSMSGPYTLPAARFREAVEGYLAEEVEAGRLLDYAEAVIDFYLACVDELLHPTLPKLANTDGDPLEWSTSTYRFAAEQRGRLLGRLDTMRNIEADAETEGEDGTAGYTWYSQGSRGALEQVSRGRLRVEAQTLVTECNSRKRDRLLRQRLEKNLGDLLEHVETRYKELDLESARQAGAPSAGDLDPENLPPEVQRQMQQMLDDIHMRWADESVPALGGRTPREAVRTDEGRAQVAALINDFENRQRRGGTPQDTFDHNRLRRELGLDEA